MGRGSGEVSGALPNLLVIGAQKAGTTLLHELLDAQPGVAMSRPKELDFFSSERGSWRRGVGWYRRQFDPGAAIRGESSPSYTAWPFAEDVPERIDSVLGDDVRFVYVVRDPIERTLSAIRHAIGTGEERRTAAEILGGDELEGTAYVAMSRYAAQLGRYTRIFGSDRVLVVDFDELIADAGRAVERVMGHCGLAASARLPTGRRANPAAEWPLRRALRRVLPERIARLVLATAAIRRLDHRLMRPAPPVEITTAHRRRLAALLAADAAAFRELTASRFARWSV